MHVILDDLQPGMRLATDLHDRSGRLLLPAGVELTEKHLRYFQMWGIEAAEVVGDGPGNEREARVDPALVARAAERARARFRHADLDHPVVASVFHHCVAVAARRLARGETPGEA